MSLVLLAIGLLATAVGFVTVGFGIPINAFSLGNTLIVAGASLIAGGLVVIGLAMVSRQLQRLTAAVVARPVVQPVIRQVEVAPEVSVAPAPSVAVSAAPEVAVEAVGSHPFEPRASEHRIPEPAALDVTPERAAAPPRQAKGPLDWLRAKPKAAPSTEPPVVEIADEAPSSPRQPRTPSPADEPMVEPKVWSPARDDSAPVEPSQLERAARSAPSGDRTKDSGLFDVVWPDPKSAPPPEPAKREPVRPSAPARSHQEPARRVGPPPAVLKSGVIDGMAYTLYADGSIEAELPQGTLNFASVDALRAHLDKHGG